MAGSWQTIGVFSDNSPAAAGVVASALTITGCKSYNWFRFVALVTGDAVGTVDITIQSKIIADTWVDWARTPTVAATVTTKYYIVPESSSVITTVGTTDDALTGPYTVVLAAGTCCGGHPGESLRAVYTAGAGTTTGAAQVVYVQGRRGD
jgi:hypothetical protein